MTRRLFDRPISPSAGRAVVRGVPGLLVVGAALVILAAPELSFSVPGVLAGPVDSPGNLQVLANCAIFAGLALGYDLLFGYAGLLSFGQSLYIGLGAYLTAIALDSLGLPLLAAVGVVALAGLVVPLVLGPICLRLRGIGFAMVTFALAEVGATVVLMNPGNLTNDSLGLQLTGAGLPGAFVGVFNTRNLYWVALGYLSLVAIVVWVALRSRSGQVWRGLRENEQRLRVVGLSPTRYALGAFVLSSWLATLGGIAYVLVVGVASSSVVSTEDSLALLVMVVIGGAGSGWGAAVGGALYELLDQRLVAASSSSVVAGLPAVLRVPLSQPLFILGAIFVVFVLFAPGGLAGLLRPGSAGAVVERWWPRGGRRRANHAENGATPDPAERGARVPLLTEGIDNGL